ncbi:MAG: ribonuclease P protein component [Gammaproteobacteria bacterium]|nr:ribonuclease P protein component [Gammaproteobacteria bacterium]
MTESANLFFKPEQRLRNGADYDTVFSDPLRSRDQYFLLLTRNNHQSHPRLGLIVSKKKIRRAVSRNRIKRIIRNSFRLNQHQLPHVDIIVLAYQQADQADTVELGQSLQKHWKKLNRKFRL